MAYHEGDTVKWNWGGGQGSGTVTKVYTRKITLKIKGQDITRDADDENPAYRIEQEDGDEVLKKHSELESA